MSRIAEQDASMRHAQGKRKTGRKATFWIIGGVAVVAIAATAWVGYRALNAKASLEAAQSLVGTVKDQAGAMDFAGIAQTSELLSEHTGTAVEQTHDPVWRIAEFVPVLGRNLTAVREMSEVVDSIATETVAPLAAVAGGLSPESLKPVDGRVNIDPIVQLSAAMGPAADAFHAATAKGTAINVDGTISQVSDASGLLSGMLTDADTLVSDGAQILALAPDLLGANGPRTYLLEFQNLAEGTALGGSAAALTELKVDNGAISISRQAATGDFPTPAPPIIEPDPKLAELYDIGMYSYLNLSTSRPDYPTAAQLARAYWQTYIGGDVDAIISVDPRALEYLINATGPIPMSTGDQLTSENTVDLLLHDVYVRWAEDNIELTDAFFAEAARNVFDTLMSPTTDVKKLIAGVTRGISEHRIMAWSAHPEQQVALAESPMGGILPTDNAETTMAGVFFRDRSTSKMDYYLQTAINYKTDVCTTETPTFDLSATMTSTATAEELAGLSEYITGGVFGAELFRTEAFIYGPPGTTLSGVSIDSQGYGTTHDLNTDDLGRPVVKFTAMLRPGESSQVSASFTGAAGDYGKPDLWIPAMLNKPNVTIDAPGCD
ncbi:hypothetical protein ASC66_09405 [Leifsonia sp. Root4]|nr:hypothetical protein ASC66_09405 [Leifsonia sp. Root4]